jgi:Asp-tRNA(Asn)/Glu-tRNA(Gln) amidotransferase A subunit family amidase
LETGLTKIMGINRYDATTARKMIAEGVFTATDYLKACLDRIAEREPEIQAFTHIAAQTALVRAATADAQPGPGALHGIPSAIKDIIDTRDMPTEHGSPIYKDSVPNSDAACVAMLRRAGAIILAKTVTPEFAAVTPGRTANPHNTKHTPGGSSSGSAAAVADFMLPAAIGTQTVGSTIRPASYCGVVGYMPSHQILPVQGVKVQAGSLDNLGILTRSVADVALLANAILDGEALFAEPAASPPRVGFCPSPHWPQAQESTRQVMAAAIELLRKAGATVEDVNLPPSFDDALPAHWTILAFEFARAMAFEYEVHRNQLSPKLVDLLNRGFATPFADYRDACAIAVARRREFAPIIAGYDVLLTPAAASEAPEGLTGPSDLLFQRFWTVLHVPAITLPGFTGPHNLPIGIQLVGPHLEDSKLLRTAAWIERAIAEDLHARASGDAAV